MNLSERTRLFFFTIFLLKYCKDTFFNWILRPAFNHWFLWNFRVYKCRKVSTSFIPHISFFIFQWITYFLLIKKTKIKDKAPEQFQFLKQSRTSVFTFWNIFFKYKNMSFCNFSDDRSIFFFDLKSLCVNFYSFLYFFRYLKFFRSSSNKLPHLLLFLINVLLFIKKKNWLQSFPCWPLWIT